MAHLTNYSLNRKSTTFERTGDSLEAVFDPASRASKRPLTAVLQQLSAENETFDTEAFYTDVAKLVQTTVAAMAPVITAYFRGHGGEGDMRCFQIVGFDVILDR